VPVDPLADSIAQLAAEIDAIQQQAVREYAPLVEAICAPAARTSGRSTKPSMACSAFAALRQRSTCTVGCVAIFGTLTL